MVRDMPPISPLLSSTIGLISDRQRNSSAAVNRLVQRRQSLPYCAPISFRNQRFDDSGLPMITAWREGGVRQGDGRFAYNDSISDPERMQVFIRRG